jgi:amino acid permease
VILLTVGLIPIILKRKLAEIKLISIIFTISVTTFILMFVIELIDYGSVNSQLEEKQNYIAPRWSYEIVTSINVLITAYAFTFSVFPVYNSFKQEVKSVPSGMKAVLYSQVGDFVIYMILSISVILLFGNSLQTSVIDNVNEQTNAYSYIIRIAFTFVLACHTPYMFFVFKESVLICIDEARYGSMSKEIEENLAKFEED